MNSKEGSTVQLKYVILLTCGSHILTIVVRRLQSQSQQLQSSAGSSDIYLGLTTVSLSKLVWGGQNFQYHWSGMKFIVNPPKPFMLALMMVWLILCLMKFNK